MASAPLSLCLITVDGMESMDSPSHSARLDAELRELTDRQRAEDAAAARRQEAWFRRQATESGTFHGVLLDLAERQVLVAVTTLDRSLIRGVIRTLGSDFVSVRIPGVGASLVAISAITSVRAEPGAPTSSGDRTIEVGASLGAVLAEMATDHPAVSVHTTAGDRVEGELRAAGQDLVTLRVGASVTYLPMATISVCSSS